MRIKKISTDQSFKRLPLDIVEPARQLGLSREKVWFLFGEVKKKGHILQDILAVTLKEMLRRSLKGAHAIGWILSLLDKKRDYRWSADQQRKHQAKEAQKASDDMRRNQIAKSIKLGQISPCGNIIDQVTGDFVTLSDPSTGKTIGSESKDNLAKRIDFQNSIKSETKSLKKNFPAVEATSCLNARTISSLTSDQAKKCPKDVEILAMKVLLQKNRGKRAVW